jgi:mRNA interferase MazF
MSDSSSWVPDCCEVILLDCSRRGGEEAPRPFLVLSPRSFNDRTSLVIGLPLTNGNGNGNGSNSAPHLSLCSCDTMHDLEQYVLSHRPKSFNWRQRGCSPYPSKSVPDSFFAQACTVLNQII